jgi:type I restriction enzyme R subunit
LAFAGGSAPAVYQAGLKKLVTGVMETLQETIGILDFWKKPIEVKKLRARIDTAILLSDIQELVQNHERIAVEIVKLAEKRHNELVQ